VTIHIAPAGLCARLRCGHGLAASDRSVFRAIRFDDSLVSVSHRGCREGAGAGPRILPPSSGGKATLRPRSKPPRRRSTRSPNAIGGRGAQSDCAFRKAVIRPARPNPTPTASCGNPSKAE
jgi:hypothetical protein